MKKAETTGLTLNDPFVCKRCSEQGPTCCQLTLGQEEFCFPLTVGEKDRIQEILPHKGGFVLQENSASFVDNLIRLFPGEKDNVRQLFPLKKDHVRLAIGPDGKCKFLGPHGCLIPVEARPYYCRLYPFWFVGNRLTVFESSGCLAVREASSISGLIKCMGTGKSALGDLFGRLRLAWGLPPKAGMKAVKKGF